MKTYRGSSPLTRGKQLAGYPHACRGRLIPAHAGKTSPLTDGVALSWAHPRSRGENVIGSSLPSVRIGSSPLTRGKRTVMCKAWRVCGLIPAHAGKTLSLHAAEGADGAHPRSRGENTEKGKGNA